MAPSTCAQCGSPLAENAKFCGQCGALTSPASNVGLSAVPDRPDPPSNEKRFARTLFDPGPRSQSTRAESSAPPTTAPADATITGGSPDLPRQSLDKATLDRERPAPDGRRVGLGTMVGFAAPESSRPGAPAPVPTDRAPTAPVEAPPPLSAVGATRSSLASAKQTMIGVAASDMLRAPMGVAPSAKPPASASPQAAPALASQPKSNLGTMLGVAIPGIAPLQQGVAAAPAAPNRTMVGVAVPGIAPIRPGDPSPALASSDAAFSRPQPRRAVEIVPKPAPLVDDEPSLRPPPVMSKRGVPLGVALGIVAVLVLVAGISLALFWKSAPLVAQPRVDAQGHEELHLTCDSCQDGTVAELDGSRATFSKKEADLALANPLKVGDNPITIHLDRPKLGRDEPVKVVVPIAFRIRADLADLSAAHPAITVRIEALAGTDVRVDNKPVALDAKGTGAYAIDISSETEGPTDETRLIDRTIPYAITPKAGETQAQTLTVRIGIAPLRLDAPGLHPVIEGPTFHLAGRSLKGAAVTANGRPVQTDADGTFVQPLDAPALGDLPVEVRASAPQLAPRTAHITVKRVTHLKDEAKAREQAPELTFGAIASDIAASVGKSTIVEGEIIEARLASNQTVALVDDARGCAHAPCLVRVVYGGDDRYKHGDVVRAFGLVTRAVTTGTTSVPEVEADFMLKGRAPH